MKKNLIKTISLENDLTLYIYDKSKRLVGDRWQVICMLQVEVPIERFDPDMVNDVDMRAVQDILGQSVCFEQIGIRNFIEENEKDEVLKTICKSLIDSLSGYLSHPKFPHRLIYKQYREKEQQNRLELLKV